MLAGLDTEDKKKTQSIADRKEAISTACMLAEKGDVILVAGKGHENYQDIKGGEERYDGYLQLENGVGMIRLLLDEFHDGLERRIAENTFIMTMSVFVHQTVFKFNAQILVEFLVDL